MSVGPYADPLETPTWRIGSVVRLKSGGPAMVVAELSPGTPPAVIATVAWTDDKGAEHTMTLDTRCLE